jgi:hypothetical protein
MLILFCHDYMILRWPSLHPPGRAGHFMIIQELDHKPGL